MRIRGHIGQWPVDLTLELEPQELAQLAQGLLPQAAAKVEPAVGASADPVWPLALQLVREAGCVDGPTLLAQLAALAGSEQAGKRLLVRLRHCPQIRMQAGADTPQYHWVD